MTGVTGPLCAKLLCAFSVPYTPKEITGRDLKQLRQAISLKEQVQWLLATSAKSPDRSSVQVKVV